MKNLFGLVAVSIFTACSGVGADVPKISSAGGEPAISATGYAKEGDKRQTGSEFTVTGVSRFVWKRTGEGDKISREFSNITVKQLKYGVASNSVMQIELDEKSHIFVYDTKTGYFTLFGGGEARANILFNNEYEYVTGLWHVENVYNIDFNSGFFLVGFNTAPETIVSRTAKAVFEGGSRIAIRYPQSEAAFTGGTSQFNVDFGAGTINGSIVFDPIITPTGNSLFSTPKITMELPSTKIEGNAFDGDLNVVTSGRNPKNITFSNAELDGQFFGPQGEELGANIWGEGKADGQKMLFQGVTVAEEN